MEPVPVFPSPSAAPGRRAHAAQRAPGCRRVGGVRGRAASGRKEPAVGESRKATTDLEGWFSRFFLCLMNVFVHSISSLQVFLFFFFDGCFLLFHSIAHSLHLFGVKRLELFSPDLQVFVCPRFRIGGIQSFPTACLLAQQPTTTIQIWGWRNSLPFPHNGFPKATRKVAADPPNVSAAALSHTSRFAAEHAVGNGIRQCGHEA